MKGGGRRKGKKGRKQKVGCRVRKGGEGEKRWWEGGETGSGDRREGKREREKERGEKKGGREKEDMETEVGDGKVGGYQAGRERKPERGR